MSFDLENLLRKLRNGNMITYDICECHFIYE